METLIQDLRYAVRALSRSPGFTVVAVTVLALGIGANTAIFSTLNAVAFATMPYSEPDRLVQILSTGPASEDPPTFMLSGNEVIEYRSQNSVFEYVAGYRNREMDYRGSFEPVTLSAASVTSDFFRMFGYEAALGRTFGPEHENRSSRGTIVVSDRFWRRYLGADPNAIGKSVRLNRNDSIVVGVLEPGYTHVEGENADIFIVVALDNQEALQARWLTVVARMKAGVSTEQVQAELDLIAPRVEEKYPDRNEGWSTSVAPLRPLLAGEVNPLLYVLLGSVFLVLLIACANVTNLFLFRAVTREREIAVRSAMGAGRGRLGREVLTESTLVALLGGGGGLMLALWGMRALVPLSPQDVLGVTAVPHRWTCPLVCGRYDGVDCDRRRPGTRTTRFAPKHFRMPDRRQPGTHGRRRSGNRSASPGRVGSRDCNGPVGRRRSLDEKFPEHAVGRSRVSD